MAIYSLKAVELKKAALPYFIIRLAIKKSREEKRTCQLGATIGDVCHKVYLHQSVCNRDWSMHV